jgi:hypothetical protein
MVGKLCIQNKHLLVDIRFGSFTGTDYCLVSRNHSDLQGSPQEPGGIVEV